MNSSFNDYLDKYISSSSISRVIDRDDIDNKNKLMILEELESLNEGDESWKTRAKYLAAAVGGNELMQYGAMKAHGKTYEETNNIADKYLSSFMDRATKTMPKEDSEYIESLGTWGWVGILGFPFLLYIYRHYISRQKNCNTLRRNDIRFLSCIIDLDKDTIKELYSKRKSCNTPKCENAIDSKIESLKNSIKKNQSKLDVLVKYRK